MDRRSFVMTLSQLAGLAATLPKTRTWPALFIGHGSPMNAIQDNAFTRQLQAIGQQLGKPQAVLVVSAHWETAGTKVATSPKPKVIYDFGGFPQALYQVQYQAPGTPALAKESAGLITSAKVLHDDEMGLDHGAWTILKFIYPEADVPVFQLSLDYKQGPAYHLQLGKELTALRKRGVLIVGSGNIVHNLRTADFRNPDAPVVAWAQEADDFLKTAIDQRNWNMLLDIGKMPAAAKMGIPTPEHYHPLLYVLGTATNQDPIQHLISSFQHGTISMRAVQVG